MTIVSTDDVLSGTPRIDGTRVSVLDVHAAVTHEMSVEEVADDWDITVEQVAEALACAEAHPELTEKQ